MRHFKARAWISESDYELVRVEIEAIDNLSFGLGLLCARAQGTVATYQRRKVNGETWLPAEVTWTASARVLLLRRLRLRGVSEFSNYRRYSVDTRTTFGAPRRSHAGPRRLTTMPWTLKRGSAPGTLQIAVPSSTVLRR